MTVNDDRRSTAIPNQPRIQVHCPADGRLVGSIPDQNPTAVAAEAQRLRAAQPAWEELGPRGRGRHMHALLDWILDNERRLVALAQNESGKSWGDASVEVGGNDPMIVFADANLEKAAAAATFGAMFNAGQTCVSVERVYVEAAVHDEFVDLLVDRVGRLRQGMDDEGAFATDVGAIATQAQLDVVEGHVTDAVANGARVLTGGSRLAEGLFFAPTVLVDVDHDMRCMREETFGPTLPVMRFSGETDAVRLANDSSFGLSASVWTGDAERAERVARRLDCGSVNVNTVLSAPFQLALPMEGWKSSGLGSRSGGAAGMLKYCRQKAIVSELPLGLTSEPFWYPHSRRKRETQSRALRFIGAHDWRRRFGRPKR